VSFTDLKTFWRSAEVYGISTGLCNLDSLYKIPTVSRHGGKLSEIEIGGPCHFTSQMSDQVPLRMGQPRQSGPVSSIMEQYLQQECERFEEFARENRDAERDEALLDGDEPDLLENPIVKHYEHDPEAFLHCAVSTLVTSGDCLMLSRPI
jgi:hypothetical protein